MSGLPRKYPGVWQSLQPPIVTRYLPRSTAGSAAFAPAKQAATRPMATSAQADNLRYFTRFSAIDPSDSGFQAFENGPIRGTLPLILIKVPGPLVSQNPSRIGKRQFDGSLRGHTRHSTACEPPDSASGAGAAMARSCTGLGRGSCRHGPGRRRRGRLARPAYLDDHPLPDGARHTRHRGAHGDGDRHGQPRADDHRRQLRLGRHQAALLRLQHPGKGRTGLRQDRPAALRDHRQPGQGQSRRGKSPARKGQGRCRVQKDQLRAQSLAGRARIGGARCGRSGQECLRPGAGPGRARPSDDRAARGGARSGRGQSRLHRHHLAGRRHRRVPQRDAGPDRGGELPNTDAVPDRHRSHQDAGRHQRERKRHRRHQAGRQGDIHRRRLSPACFPGHGDPGPPVAANGPERGDLRCRRERRQRATWC